MYPSMAPLDIRAKLFRRSIRRLKGLRGTAFNGRQAAERVSIELRVKGTNKRREFQEPKRSFPKAVLVTVISLQWTNTK